MKRKRLGPGLGLLAERKRFAQEAAAADAQKAEEGRVPDSALQREPDPTDFPGKMPKKRYQAPCFFSCTPDGWEPVDVNANAVIAVAPAKAVAVASYTIPQGMIFRLVSVGNNWSTGGGGNLVFRVTVNGDPIGEGYAAFTHQMGDINVLDMAHIGMNVKAEGKTVVAIEVLNSSATPYTAFARFRGLLGPDK